MKLIKQTATSWKYLLNQAEADALKDLMGQFPFTGNCPAIISKTEKNPKSVERETLLNESLAAHRNELKTQAKNLVTASKLKRSKKGHLLTLSSEQREIMLQILNDIRVGCWRVLGEPETMELVKSDYSAQELAHHRLLNLAGYFQHHLIGLN